MWTTPELQRIVEFFDQCLRDLNLNFFVGHPMVARQADRLKVGVILKQPTQTVEPVAVSHQYGCPGRPWRARESISINSSAE